MATSSNSRSMRGEPTAWRTNRQPASVAQDSPPSERGNRHCRVLCESDRIRATDGGGCRVYSCTLSTCQRTPHTEFARHRARNAGAYRSLKYAMSVGLYRAQLTTVQTPASRVRRIAQASRSMPSCQLVRFAGSSEKNRSVRSASLKNRGVMGRAVHLASSIATVYLTRASASILVIGRRTQKTSASSSKSNPILLEEHNR